jgi:RNA polymerase sigma factor (sigma-70 family)
MEKKVTEEFMFRLLKNEKSRREGMAVLIRTYQERLYWHIRKMVINHDDAKDVLQETLVRTWKNIHQFNGDSAVFSWLFRIASNESFRFLERKQRHLRNRMSMQEMLIRELETDPLISGDEIQIALQKAILSLTNRQRLVFNMHYFDEMDYSEIAVALKTTVNNVKVLFHNARKQIEEIIKEEI